MTATATKQRRPMSPEHKEALAEGRRHGGVVRRYLEAIDANKPRRGRKRTPDSIRARLAHIEETLDDASPVERLKLIQERMNLSEQLENLESSDDLASLEEEFISVASEYGARKGITYAAWRELGVSPETLHKAGITR